MWRNNRLGLRLIFYRILGRMIENYKLVLVLDRLRSAHNVGNIFRLAEALGASEIIACGYTPAPPHPKLEKTAMGADKMVPCRQMENSLLAVETLRREGFKQILAVECADNAVLAWKMDYKFPLVKLPMFGAKESINVGNAAAAVLYAMAARVGLSEKEWI